MAEFREVLFGLLPHRLQCEGYKYAPPPLLLYVAGRRMLDFPGGHFKYLQYLADPHLVAIAETSQRPTE